MQSVEKNVFMVHKKQDMIDRFPWNINILMIQSFFYKVRYHKAPAKFHSQLQDPDIYLVHSQIWIRISSNTVQHILDPRPRG